MQIIWWVFLVTATLFSTFCSEWHSSCRYSSVINICSSSFRYLWKTGGQLISCCSTPSSRTRWIVPNWFRSSEPPKRNSTRPTKGAGEHSSGTVFWSGNPNLFVIYLNTFDLEKERLWPRMPGGDESFCYCTVWCSGVCSMTKSLLKKQFFFFKFCVESMYFISTLFF